MTLLLLLIMILMACFGAWKAALIMLCVTLLLDFLIAILRVGARATLEEGEFSLRILAGPVKLKLLPKDEDKAKKLKKPKKKPEEPPKEEEEKEEKPKRKLKITMELVRTALSALGDALGRLRRKLSIDLLTIRYTVASDDPYSAAMTYGYASAAVGALMPVIENIFKVKKSDIRTDVTFDAKEAEMYIDAQFTIAIWEIIYIALAVVPVIKPVLAGLKKGKVDLNGKSSDQ